MDMRYCLPNLGNYPKKKKKTHKQKLTNLHRYRRKYNLKSFDMEHQVKILTRSPRDFNVVSSHWKVLLFLSNQSLQRRVITTLVYETGPYKLKYNLLTALWKTLINSKNIKEVFPAGTSKQKKKKKLAKGKKKKEKER